MLEGMGHVFLHRKAEKIIGYGAHLKCGESVVVSTQELFMVE
jgi:hypothetical protein